MNSVSFYFKNLNDLVKSSDYFKSKGFEFPDKAL